MASVNARIGWKALTAAEYLDEGYVFLNTPNIKGRDIDFDDVNYISEFRFQESPELRLREGDVLLAKDGSTLGIVNIVRTLPRPATVNGSIAVIRPHDVDPRFLRYSLESAAIQGRIQMVKDGMGVPHLFQWDINRLPLLLPPLDEQRRIADFLDDQVALIDKIVKARSEQITLLREGQSHLLVEAAFAVGGAADDTLPWFPVSKPTWQRLKLAWIARCLDAVRVPLSAVQRESLVGPYPYYGASTIVDHVSDFLFDEELVLVGEDGASLANPRFDVVQRVSGKVWVNNHAHVLRATSIEPDFLAHFLRTVDRPLLISGATRPKITQEDLMSLPVVVPPPSDRVAMIAFCEERLAADAAGVDAITASIAALKELQSSLITAAVSGHLDVVSASGCEVTV